MLETIRYLFGSSGPSGYGSKSTAEQVTEACPDLRYPITAIITGATSGIGAETARVLAMRGASLILPARSLKNAEETKSRILSEFPGSEIIAMKLDLSSISSVQNFAAEFISLDLPLNLLINNAGKFCYDYAVSEDGIEMTFATNHLGHFLLTNLLLKKMVETAEATGTQGRIVNLTSSVHSWFSGDMIHYLSSITKNRSHYDPTRAYALSKLANVLHTKELAQRLEEMKENVTANCVHPGVVKTRLNREREGSITDLVFLLGSKLFKTIPQGAATTCYVATHPRVDGVSGKYFVDCNEASPSKPATGTAAEASRLWCISEAMVARDANWMAVLDPINGSESD